MPQPWHLRFNEEMQKGSKVMAMTDKDMATLNKLVKQRKNKGPQTDADAAMMSEMSRNANKGIPCASCPSPERCMAAGTCMKNAMYK